MLRTGSSLAGRTGAAKHVRVLVDPTSSLSNTAPKTQPTDPVPTASGGTWDDGNAVKNNYWEKEPKAKRKGDNAKDSADKDPVRKGVMQKLFF